MKAESTAGEMIYWSGKVYDLSRFPLHLPRLNCGIKFKLNPTTVLLVHRSSTKIWTPGFVSSKFPVIVTRTLSKKFKCDMITLPWHLKAPLSGSVSWNFKLFSARQMEFVENERIMNWSTRFAIQFYKLSNNVKWQCECKPWICCCHEVNSNRCSSLQKIGMHLWRQVN